MIKIGTSGWQYGDWKELFYPSDLKSADKLKFYSKYLNTVEINSTFYHMPRITTIEKWKSDTPDDFKITIKLNRYFTHSKKLNIDEEFEQKFNDFINNISVLENKLGVLLVQLPPSLKFDLNKLERFLNLINNRVKVALEARNDTWFNDETKNLLEKYDVYWVINDSPNKWPSIEWIINKKVYIRMHGRKKLYSSKYTEHELDELLKFIKSRSVIDGYIYFNNTMGGSGILNALELTDKFKKCKL